MEDSPPPCLDPTGLNCMLRRPKRSPEQAKLEHPDRECLDPTGIYCVPINQARPKPTKPVPNEKPDMIIPPVKAR